MTVLYWGRFLEEQRDADIPTQHWAIPEKKQTGGLRTYIFEKPLGIFRFFILLMEILRPKTKTLGTLENPLAISSISLP